MPKSGFVRGFSATAGVLLALSLFMAVCCGGCLLLYSPAAIGTAERSKQHAAIKAEARKKALASLSKYGIVSIGENCRVEQDSRNVGLIGVGRDLNGDLRELSILWKVNTFNKKQVWQLDFVKIDDDFVE